MRALTLCALVVTGSIAGAPARAEPHIYPPILDPTRPVRDFVNGLVAPDAAETVQQTVADTVVAECHFSGATIEGVAAADGVPETTGVVCRVYDERGVQRGGCALFANGPAAACAAPTEVVLGPPRVCTTAYATYSWGTYREEHCN